MRESEEIGNEDAFIMVLGLRGSQWVWWLVCLGASFLLSGCGTGRFYAQAIHGQAGLLVRRDSIDRLLKEDETTADLKEQLLLVQSLLTFAAERLELPSRDVYTSYVELDRPYVVWNVAVCPEFDMKPKSWWYPIVGRLEHRGYFKKRVGVRFGEKMRRKGFDVAVGGVSAYSTLGWFRDPVLSSFISFPDVALAELIFHELAHRKLFVKGDTDFNEAYAVVVAEAGVLLWLEEQGRAEDAARYQNTVEAQQGFMELVLELRDTLVDSYRRGRVLDWSLDQRRIEKATHIEDFKRRFELGRESNPDWGVFAGWVDKDINNAEINVLDTYYGWLPAFRSLLERSQNWQSFYREVERIGGLPSDARNQALLSERAIEGEEREQ